MLQRCLNRISGKVARVDCVAAVKRPPTEKYSADPNGQRTRCESRAYATSFACAPTRVAETPPSTK